MSVRRPLCLEENRDGDRAGRGEILVLEEDRDAKAARGECSRCTRKYAPARESACSSPTREGGRGRTIARRSIAAVEKEQRKTEDARGEG